MNAGRMTQAGIEVLRLVSHVPLLLLWLLCFACLLTVLLINQFRRR